MEFRHAAPTSRPPPFGICPVTQAPHPAGNGRRCVSFATDALPHAPGVCTTQQSWRIEEQRPRDGQPPQRQQTIPACDVRDAAPRQRREDVDVVIRASAAHRSRLSGLRDGSYGCGKAVEKNRMRISVTHFVAGAASRTACAGRPIERNGRLPSEAVASPTRC